MAHFQRTGQHLAAPLVSEVKTLLLAHLQDHYSLYGEFLGVRSARKHIGWYFKQLPGNETFQAHMNRLEDGQQQMQAVTDFLDALNQHMDRLPPATHPQRLARHLETTT